MTDESFSDIHDAEINLHSDFLLDEQSFTTCFDEELSSYQEDETIRDDFLNHKLNEPVNKDPILLNDTTVYGKNKFDDSIVTQRFYESPFLKEKRENEIKIRRFFC